MDACVTKAPKKLSVSEKIDRVVTNRVLGIPIFIVVMVFVYWLAISTVGTGGTDWVNDNLFGDGFFINSASEEAYTAEQEAYDAHITVIRSTAILLLPKLMVLRLRVLPMR